MGWGHIIAIFKESPDISHVALCVLIVIAKSADGKGECYPSVGYIAEKSKLSKRSVQRGLEELKERGYVTWTSGKKSCDVNRYRITEKVINKESKSEDKLSSSTPHSHTTGGEVCHSVIHSMTESPTKYDTQSHRSNNEVTNELSLLLYGRESARQGASAEEVPAQQGTVSAEKPPSAAGLKEDEYERLVRTNGWKPRNRKDSEQAALCCWKIGASAEEAKSFARYNNVRRWNAINEMTSVRQLAKEWVKVWRWKHPEEWAREQKSRKDRRS